ncbi:MAG: hypothetical protein U0667_17750 [Chloroflexota bacterium]
MTDRAAMDNHAYYLRACQGADPYAVTPLVTAWATTYDLVVRLLPDVPLRADGTRSTADVFRDEVEAILDRTLPEMVPSGRLVTMAASDVRDGSDWWPLAERHGGAGGRTAAPRAWRRRAAAPVGDPRARPAPASRWSRRSWPSTSTGRPRDRGSPAVRPRPRRAPTDRRRRRRGGTPRGRDAGVWDWRGWRLDVASGVLALVDGTRHAGLTLEVTVEMSRGPRRGAGHAHRQPCARVDGRHGGDRGGPAGPTGRDGSCDGRWGGRRRRREWTSS